MQSLSFLVLKKQKGKVDGKKHFFYLMKMSSSQKVHLVSSNKNQLNLESLFFLS